VYAQVILKADIISLEGFTKGNIPYAVKTTIDK
jgi:hypothetical protein